ncbi:MULTISPECIES: DUF4262 domain-containing protein [unclassified Streptomyces]|uniref:DUF4262 domain-containing protein n=1 Tax=unclassified Streptomyces TaxID=2593676 RepID=UPI000DD5166A|nr:MULTISPECIES: DUF4262 domain-containing protein [unclassified Streptomyces]QZZ25532.1 DUF4262 domain-containing protein [Streptomyces sp. ST1015]
MTDNNYPDAYLRRVKEIIDRHGRAVQYVHGDPRFGVHPFAYTIGLHTRPDCDYELAVTGLDGESSALLLDTLADVLATRHLTPADGLEIGGILPGTLTLRLRPVEHPEDLGIIHALYGTTPPVWQAVWPDDIVAPQPRRSQPLL